MDDEIFNKPGDWEIRTTIYRNGVKIATADRLGDDYGSMVWLVGNALELRAVEIHTPKKRRGKGEQQ